MNQEKMTIGYAPPPQQKQVSAGHLLFKVVAWGVAILILLVGGWITLIAAGCIPVMGSYNDSMSRQKIEQLGGLKLPASATDIRSRMHSWQGNLLLIRFSMAPDEVSTFVKSTGIAEPLSTTEIPIGIMGWSDIARWWKPGNPKLYEAGEGEAPQVGSCPPDVILQRILIDKSDPNRYVVWFVSSFD